METQFLSAKTNTMNFSDFASLLSLCDCSKEFIAEMTMDRVSNGSPIPDGSRGSEILRGSVGHGLFCVIVSTEAESLFLNDTLPEGILKQIVNLRQGQWRSEARI